MKNLLKCKVSVFSLLVVLMLYSCSDESTMNLKSSTLKSGEFEIPTDVKWNVTSGTASSEELVGEGAYNGAFIYSYDGDATTFWHSKWQGGSDPLPISATWTLQADADILDYALYTPRGGNPNGNGTWQKIDVFVSTDASPNYTKVISDFDCVAAGYPVRIDFPTPIQNPKSINIVIKQGVGNFASCGEMEFYKKADTSVSPKYKELRMSNVGYVEPDLYAGDGGSVMKLRQATSIADITGKAFFKFEQAGTVRIQALLKNNNINKRIKVEFNELNAELNIPVTQGYEWVTITTAYFNAAPGYSCMKFKNLTSGDIFIDKLRIIGNASDGVTFNNPESPRRNAVSVHLGYPVTGIPNVEWFYNEITIPEGFDEPYHSFYMANGWFLGYSGIQTRDVTGPRSSKILIFSCWNSKETDNPDYWAKVTKKGDNVISSAFGGEGTGAKTHVENFDWKTGQTYSFLLQARVSTGTPGSTMQKSDTTYYSLFWKEKEAADWNFQATIMSPYNGRSLYGLYSFVENYIGIDGQHQRQALYHNQWVKNADGWTQLLKADFTSDGGKAYRNDIGAGVHGNGYFLWNGGFINNAGWPGDRFTRNSSTTQPLSESELIKLERISR